MRYFYCYGKFGHRRIKCVDTNGKPISYNRPWISSNGLIEVDKEFYDEGKKLEEENCLKSGFPYWHGFLEFNQVPKEFVVLRPLGTPALTEFELEARQKLEFHLVGLIDVD